MVFCVVLFSLRSLAARRVEDKPSIDQPALPERAGDQCCGQGRADAWQFVEPTAHLIGAMPGIDLPVARQDLHAQLRELEAKSLHALPSEVRDAPVFSIGDNVEQLLDAAATDPRDKPSSRSHARPAAW